MLFVLRVAFLKVFMIIVSVEQSLVNHMM